MNMRVPLEVTAESMEGTDDARGKRFPMIERVHPVGNRLNSSLEEKIQKSTVLSEKSTEFQRDRKDNVSVAAVNQLCGDRIGTVCLIGGATSIAEAGFAAERYIVESIAVMAVVETIAIFAVTTTEHLLDFTLDNGADAWI